MSVIKSKPDLSLKSDELGLNPVELSPNLSLATSKPSNRIIVDSGASEHYSPNKDWFIDYKEVKNKSIIVANGQRIPIRGIGNIPIIGDNRELLITNVNYIPEIKTTLLSPRELAKKGWKTLFKGQIGSVIHPSLKISLKATWDYNAYYLDFKIDSKVLCLSQAPETSESCDVQGQNSKVLDLYHKRLNHISKEFLIKTLSQLNLADLSPKSANSANLRNCDSCYKGKFTRVISREPLKSTSEALAIIDCDIAGPFRTRGYLGERYFITLTDRASRAI